MANKTFAENIGQTISDFKSIREAIEAQGWNLEGAKTSEYPEILKLIPSTIFEEGVTEIEEYKFMVYRVQVTDSSGVSTMQGEPLYKKLALTTLPDTLTRIGNHAFFGCSNLALTSLPEGLTRIGGFAFSDCTSLALTNLPDSVTSIGGHAFQGCMNLTAITFNSVPHLSMTIVNGVGVYAQFEGCSNLTDIFVPWSEGEVEGAPWGAENATVHYLNLKEGMTEIADYAFMARNIINADSGDIMHAGNTSYAKLALTKLPDTITSIGKYAFYWCENLALTSLPEGLTSIGNSAFLNCSNLALTSLPEGVKSIGSNTFHNCTNLALTSLPEGLTSIGNSAFLNCSNLALTSLPASIEDIGPCAFLNCTSLTTLTFNSIPRFESSITTDGTAVYSTFSNCTNLLDIFVPWSEGEVEGAPWGATNATIHYNHVAE